LKFAESLEGLLQDVADNGNTDQVFWVSMGQIFANVQHEEFAFNCFYQAHLRNHAKIRANSELKYDVNKVKQQFFYQEGGDVESMSEI